MLYGIWKPTTPDNGQPASFGITGKIFPGPEGVIAFEALVTQTARVHAAISIIRSTDPSMAENLTFFFEGDRVDEMFRGILKSAARYCPPREIRLARELSSTLLTQVEMSYEESWEQDAHVYADTGKELQWANV